MNETIFIVFLFEFGCSDNLRFSELNKAIPKGIGPLLGAGFVSSMGDSMHQVALMWLIYDLTGSQTATGLIGMSQYLPSVLVGLFAGALVDRLNRKQVMIVSDAARTILVALIPVLYFAQTINGLVLGLLAFAIAIFTTLFTPARESVLPQLVGEDELTRAGSALQASYGLAFFAGPVLAAVLLPFVQVTGLFYADALTYLISLVFLLRLRPRALQQPSAEKSAWSLMQEGIRYAKKHALIRGLLMLTAVDNLFIMGPALVGAPLYVRLHLGLGASAYAAVEGAFALGMIAGSVLVHRIGHRLPRGRTLLIAIMFDGITFVPFMFMDTLWPVLTLWFVHSIGIPFILVPRTTLVQTEVPNLLQGRVFSMIGLTVVGLSAISCSLTGMIAEVLPVNVLFGVIGISATVVGTAGWWIRELRSAR